MLELLQGVWSMKSPLKPKIEKKGSATHFLMSLLKYLQEKKSQISVQLACGDHPVLTRQSEIKTNVWDKQLYLLFLRYVIF